MVKILSELGFMPRSLILAVIVVSITLLLLCSSTMYQSVALSVFRLTIGFLRQREASMNLRLSGLSVIWSVLIVTLGAHGYGVSASLSPRFLNGMIAIS